MDISMTLVILLAIVSGIFNVFESWVKFQTNLSSPVFTNGGMEHGTSTDV